MVPGAVQAADFTITNGQVETNGQILFDNETGVVDQGGALNTVLIGTSAIVALGANVVIDINGVVTTAGKFSIGVASSGADVVVTNSGSVATTGEFSPGLKLNGSNGEAINIGTISTAGDGAWGVSLNAADGTLDNTGSISTTGIGASGIDSRQVDAVISSGGAIMTTNIFAHGISSSGDVAQINNTGAITVSDDRAYGIKTTGADAVVSNSGAISAAGNDSYGVYSNDINAAISNSGTMSLSGDRAAGIRSVAAGAVIDNSGVISLTGDSAAGIAALGANGTINNSGVISVTGASPTAILGAANDDIVNLNSGSHVTGAIVLDAGDDMLSINGAATIIGDINMGAGIDHFIINATSDGAHTGAISNVETLVKEGAGTFVLSGVNSYSGSTTVNNGVLQGTTSSLQGDILNNATVAFDQTTNGTYSDILSGAGGITKDGGGRVILSGANSYSGGTTVTGGVLEGTTLSLQGDILNNANVTFDQTTDGTYSDILSGSGGLTKSGGGRVILSGANSYSGSTTVNNGVLEGTTSSLQGDILNNANITFDQTTDGTYSNILSGSGGTTKDGGGKVILSGANSYAGDTTIHDGVLALQGGAAISDSGAVTMTNGVFEIDAAETIGSLAGAGAVTLNSDLTTGNAVDTTYSGVISGAGGLNKQGAGSFTLSGVSGFSGGVALNEGALLVNGSAVNSIFDVNAGGVLGGNGAVGAVNINPSGSIAPGNSIGTINVAGDVTFGAGSFYLVEVNAAGAGDLITADGSADLTGAAVVVQPVPGVYGRSTDYTILTAAGGLAGTTFDSVSSDLAFLYPILTYDANNVYLTLDRNNVAFEVIAATPNQTAVAKVLTAEAAIDPTVLRSIIDSVLMQNQSGAQQILTSLGGVQHTHQMFVVRRQVSQFMRRLVGRTARNSNTGFDGERRRISAPLTQTRLAYQGDDWAAFAGGDRTGPQGAASHGRGWWLQGTGGFGNINDTAMVRGADFNTTGLAFGVDSARRNAVIGLGGEYARADIDTADSNLKLDIYQLAAYGGMNRGAFNFGASLGFGLHATDAMRIVDMGSSKKAALANYNSYDISAALEGARDIALSQSAIMTPHIAIDYIHTWRDAFVETGEGPANLSFAGASHDSLKTSLGLRFGYKASPSVGARLTPTVSIAYEREHLDDVIASGVGFAALPSSAFQIDGVEIDRNRLRMGLGLTGRLSDIVSIDVAYDGELAHSHDIHMISAAGRVSW